MTSTRQELTAEELASIRYHKSRLSGEGANGGSCVEAGLVGDGSGRVAVRHSHHPDRPPFVYTAEEWDAFTGGVKLGDFDFKV
jgi:hypothetical protein